MTNDERPLLASIESIRTHCRKVSLFYTEKILLIIDFIQLYGLLWNMAQSWGLPFIWVDWMKWVVYVNADIFSTTANGSLMGKSNNNISKWGEMNGYLPYALWFSLASMSLCSLALVCRVVAKSAVSNIEKRSTIISHIINTLLLAYRLLYMPALLALSRLFYCEGEALAADPSETCGSARYIMYTTLCTLFCAPLLIGLPIALYYYTYGISYYSQSSDHEKRVQAWEISHMLGTDDTYYVSQLAHLASYKRHSVYFHIELLIAKLVSVVIFVTMRANLIAQAVIYFFLLFVWFLRCVVQPPFRLKSTNVILVLLLISLLSTAIFGMFNAFGVKNSVMVASTETLILLAIHAAALLCMIILMVVIVITKNGLWPTERTLLRNYYSAQCPRIRSWCDALVSSSSIYMNALLSSLYVTDIQSLEEQIRLLRQHWIEAQHIGSVFNIVIGDMLESLLIAHAQIRDASRKHNYWDEAYIELAPVISQRRARYTLMTKEKRRILTKLLAMRGFIGNRNIEKFIDDVGIESQIPRHDERVTYQRKLFEAAVASLTDKTEALLKTTRQHGGVATDLELVVELYDEWNDLIDTEESSHHHEFITETNKEEWITYRRLLYELISQLDNISDEDNVAEYDEHEDMYPLLDETPFSRKDDVV